MNYYNIIELKHAQNMSFCLVNVMIYVSGAQRAVLLILFLLAMHIRLSGEL